MTLLIWYCYIISSRPIAGYVNFCSSGLNANSDDDFIFAVAKHEFLHAMVSNRNWPSTVNLLFLISYIYTTGFFKIIVPMVEGREW